MNKIKNIILAIVITAIFIAAYCLTYKIIEPKVYDFMLKNVLTQTFSFDKYKNVNGHDDIVLVMVDDKSVERYRWPWKRELFTKVIDYFEEYTEAKVLVQDMVIATPDRDNPESDKKFYNSVSKSKSFVSGLIPIPYTGEETDADKKYDKKFIEKYALNVDVKTEMPELYGSLMKFPEPYFNALAHTGSVSMYPGFINGDITLKTGDEIFRNHELVFNYYGYTIPSLSFSAFMLANNHPNIIINKKSVEIPDLNYKIPIKISKYQTFVPIKFYKNDGLGYSHKVYSAIEIMDSFDSIKNGKKPKINPKEFKNKYVIFGANVSAGAGLNDVKNTPLNANQSGSDIQATCLDNLVHKDFLKIISDFWNILFAILGMIIIYTVIRVNDLYKAISLSIASIIGYLLICVVCYYYSVIINVATPVVMFVLTMIFAYTHKFVLENRSKEKVKKAMGKYMSEDVMKRVVQNIDNLGLGGKKATVTVLFADIRGFTSMSEQMTAQQVSEILNEYFTEMEPIITKYNGIINKFIGDAVMAIFGEPIQDKNHPQNAVRCGYEMLEKVKELHKKWEQENKPRIEIGVGINTGEVFVGNIGSVNRMEYTVIGDTVNLASRLESYNKIYKTKMLISTSTYEETKGIIDVMKISDVEIRGKANKMNIYEVLSVIN